MLSAIEIKDNSRTPKYLQLAHSLSTRIEDQTLSREEQLPSINLLSSYYDISRDTARKAYLELKRKNLVVGVKGKGYYIKEDTSPSRKRIFFLTNKLSAHKKALFEAFQKELGPDAKVELFIYNNRYEVFRHLLLDNLEGYSHYVIIPHFYSDGDKALELINRIPKNKLILLDKKLKGISGDYACVYQDFENNIYDSMHEALQQLKKYKLLKLIFPLGTYQPREIIHGFQSFCIKFGFQGKLVTDVSKEPIEKGEVYITMMEEDLVTVVKRIKSMDLKVGNEVGILSYNENPLKEVLLDGITVMSTDFQMIGRSAARLIHSGEKEHISNPFRLILRNSL